MRIHSGRPYKCKKCSECFVSRFKLRKHVHSIHTAEEPYKCTECNKCFVYPSLLREHVRESSTLRKIHINVLNVANVLLSILHCADIRNIHGDD
ncbi:hypothetical protein CDAR_514091 [Caerostris darwini]|uniref:C2H2-type domain-containing protein n=1 Tax=Caerostris darwini TaxID=1538125 RepID=A0AAV4R1I8_9ARAC|nr:hypothetical protein CDAR_514091 [Caerostris darwini]